MAIAFFMCPMSTVPGGKKGKPWVKPLVNLSYDNLINADNGGAVNISLPAGGTPAVGWAWVKVRASAASLLTINGDAAIDGFAAKRIDDTLASISPAVQTFMKNRLLFLRYSNAEIQAALGNDLTTKTFKDYVVFAASRMTPPTAVDVNTVTWGAADIPQDSLVAAEFVDAAL